MRDRRYLLLHGWQGSGPEHWQRWLAPRLGTDARYPTFPDPDTPQLEDWLAALDAELGRAPDARWVLACHSLGCLLVLHDLARAGAATPIERALLVAPPSRAGGVAEIESFYPVPLADAADAGAALRLVCSDDDPYCPERADRVYAEPLAIPADVIAGAAHINADAGYGPWPAVERWCRDGTVPLVARPAVA